MPDFRRRATTLELMDTEACDFETFRACLADLSVVNRLTLAYRPTLDFLERLRREGRLPKGRALAILDVGSGYGDMLRKIATWADRRGVEVALTGVDLNPWSARAARAVTPASQPIRWVTADLFDCEAEGIDLVISSLFTHHLAPEQVVAFLRWMEATTGLGWLVNDLHRHPLPYYGFAALAQLMRWHRFVRHDGPLSIARAFQPADWRAMLEEAEVPADAAEVARRFPWRLCVSRVRAA